MYYDLTEKKLIRFIEKTVMICGLRLGVLPGTEIWIAKDRVKHRVENGGHGIPEKDIEKRYVETFQQLNSEYLKRCKAVARLLV